MKLPNPRRQRLIRRLQWSPDRAGIVWMLAAAIVAVAMFAAVVIYHPFLAQRTAGAGFGPDWDCTPHPAGEPTCIKKISP